MENNVITNRHDIYLLFEVTNGNPNGDPDMDNMPRQEDNTEKGLVSDVCLKRKIRNYVFLSNSKETIGRRIFIQNTHYLNDVIEEHHKNSTERLNAEGLLAKDTKKKNADKKLVDIATVESLCQEFFDIRTFGAVVSTGKMAGSPYGQIQGPVQVTFAQSFDPISPQQITITRQAKTDVKEDTSTQENESDSQTGGGTMGNKFVVPYGLYAAKIYVSPAFAERTGFTNHDLDVLFEALGNMFEHDRSAARGEMIVRGIYDFEHIGTQHENNADANKREARLGCCHAHKLFEGINVNLKEGKEFPESFKDYEVNCSWTESNLPKGVKLHKRHE
jgi:CRISPR-associated protein Csd2